MNGESNNCDVTVFFYDVTGIPRAAQEGYPIKRACTSNFWITGFNRF